MHTTRISEVKIRVANLEMHTTRISAVKIRVANFETHTTRISAVKIRVANFETHTTRIFAVKIRVANFEMHTTRISVVKIRVANVKCEKNKWMSYMSHGISIFLYLRIGFHYWLSRESPDNIHKRISLQSCYNSVRILHSQLNIRWYLKSKFRDRMFFFLRWTEIEKPEIEVFFRRYGPVTI